MVCCGDHLFGDVVGQAQGAERVAHHAGGPQIGGGGEWQHYDEDSDTVQGGGDPLFACQMMTWANIYTSSVCNLLNYSTDNKFIINNTLPHMAEEETYSRMNIIHVLWAFYNCVILISKYIRFMAYNLFIGLH